MDVTDADDARFRLGVEQLLQGESLVYAGVALWLHGEQCLHASAFSEWAPERTTEAHAREKIAHAKLALAELTARSTELRDRLACLQVEYFCNYDYGQGSIALAREANEQFDWLFRRA